MNLTNDYMVSIGTDFILVPSLKYAREKAKEFSVKYGKATIQKWTYEYELDDYILDDYFYIKYINGIEQPSDD